MSLLSREEVYRAIDLERQHQIEKYGENRAQSLPGFLLVAQAELDEAKEGWIKNRPGRSSPLAELLQVAAVCVAALEKYGISGNTFNTDDYVDYSTARTYEPGSKLPSDL